MKSITKIIDGDKGSIYEGRQVDLNELGFKVIRFTNDEVFGNGNLVESKIRDEVMSFAGNTQRTPPQPSAKYFNMLKSGRE